MDESNRGTKRRRVNVNNDPHWTNWEYLAAFGEDELGYTYLDAIKRFCCLPSEEEAWLEELVRRARQAHDAAGQSRRGREAAWAVLRRAGMILRHDRMAELRVGAGILRPRAAFLWPGLNHEVVVSVHWKPVIQQDVPRHRRLQRPWNQRRDQDLGGQLPSDQEGV